uniref:MIT_C domain-containing protein n=1 Tax=Strongyloides stercoralis TaxID=6248 RepID=A0A0K0DZ46_STRER
MSYKSSKFYNKCIYSTENQEEELLNAFEVEKKRIDSTNNLEIQSALDIAKSVEKELKKLVNDSKNFKNIRSKVGRYLITHVQPIISRLESGNLLDNDVIIENNLDELSNMKQKYTKGLEHELVAIVKIKDKQTGLSFEKIFTKDRIGDNVTRIRIEDPYMITKEQTNILYLFILAMKNTYDSLEYIEVKTKINPGKSDIFKELNTEDSKSTKAELLIKERDMIRSNLEIIKNKCKEKGIDFKFTFGDSTMHDRRIFFNSGVIAYLGRGLSIYYFDSFKDGRHIHELPCKECDILILRSKD